MAHFAKISDENIVLSVLVVDNHDIVNEEGQEVESLGQQWLQTHNNWPAEKWIQTSYNTFQNTHEKGGTPFRGNYAGVGFTWDPVNNIFWPPKPYDSWVQDIPNAKWKSPIGDKPVPESDEFLYLWNEDNQTWDKISKNG